MSSAKPHEGGLIPSASSSFSPPASAPLREGEDVSWLSLCRVGDNQGDDGACAIFSMANWAEIMHGSIISDQDCISVYRKTLKKVGRGNGGLSFSEAFAAARDEGWLPGSVAIRRVYDLSELENQPIIAGYTITPAWDTPSGQGCLDHWAGKQDEGYHAVVIVGHGQINNLNAGPWIYIENSWGIKWAWNGIGVMSEKLHKELCRELWVIE